MQNSFDVAEWGMYKSWQYLDVWFQSLQNVAYFGATFECKFFVKYPNLVQCDQICRNFATWAKFKKVFGQFLIHYLVFDNIVNLIWQIFYAFVQNFVVLTGQKLKK